MQDFYEIKQILTPVGIRQLLIPSEHIDESKI